MPDDEARRSTFSSTWGTVLSTAGVAIGLGNIWRFPYMMGQYGGAVFLVVYLVIVVAFGLPALMAEWSLGRHTRRGTWAAFQRAGLPGGRAWSYLLLVTVIMAASYYGVVLASVLELGVTFLSSAISSQPGTTPVRPSDRFSIHMLFVVATTALGGGCLYFGVKAGIERASKVALPAFFILFIILIVRVLTLDGATAGLRAFLMPRWEDFQPTTPLAALGQAFFSMGLGGTFMLVYGSYLRRDEDIPRSAVFTAGADMTAALMAGLIVVPAAVVFAIPLDSGPPLMFDVMPRVFSQMPAGDGFGALFFGAVFLVAMLSLVAAYEVLIAAAEDGLGWSRRRGVATLVVIQIILAVPALRIDRYIEFSDLVWGSTMQPVGGVIAVVAFAWCLGQTRALEELRRHSKLPIPRWLFYWLKYGVPTGIIVTLIYGLAGSTTFIDLLHEVLT